MAPTEDHEHEVHASVRDADPSFSDRTRNMFRILGANGLFCEGNMKTLENLSTNNGFQQDVSTPEGASGGQGGSAANHFLPDDDQRAVEREKRGRRERDIDTNVGDAEKKRSASHVP